MVVTATKVDDVVASSVPGAFQFDENGIQFNCPCGCGSMLGASFPRWTFDADKITLTPSVRRLDGCKWHGFLTDGVFTFCEDSGRG